MSTVNIAFGISLGRGLVGLSFSCSPEKKNIYLLLTFQLNSRLNVVALYFWTMSYERINQASGESPIEPAESKF